jgi:hypothetical protein
LAATDKISNLFNADAVSYFSNFGWQPIIYPTGQKLIINVPAVEAAESRQYVMNTSSGAWCSFSGWRAWCFEILGENLYFGTAGKVCQADTGFSDNGANIVSVAQQAFSYFGDSTQNKQFKMVRPIFMSDGFVNPAIVLNTDFQENRTTVAPSFTGGMGTAWDDGEWDAFSWASGDTIIQKWQSVTGIGYSGGIRVVTNMKDINCRWISTDFVYERGGIL